MEAILGKPLYKPEKMNINKLLADIGETAVNQFNITKRTFEEVDPTFEMEIEENKSVTVAPEDDRDGEIWGFLNNGTDVRHAVMTPEFEAQTRPGFLIGSQGRGGVGFISRDIILPGIEPRGWTGIVSDDLTPRFIRAVEDMLKEAVF